MVVPSTPGHACRPCSLPKPLTPGGVTHTHFPDQLAANSCYSKGSPSIFSTHPTSRPPAPRSAETGRALTYLIKYTSYFPAERPDFLCLSFRVQPSGRVGSSYMGPRSRMMERRCLGEAEASGTAGAEPDPSEVSALPASAGSAEWWAGGCRGSCLPSLSSFLSFFTFLNFRGLSLRPWRSWSSDFSSLKC